MRRALKVGGYFQSGQLSRRMRQLCIVRGWQVLEWCDDAIDEGIHLECPELMDILICDTVAFLNRALSSSHNPFGGLAVLLDGEAEALASDTLCLASSQDDDTLVHAITTALNVERFYSAFRGVHTAEPISKCAHNEDLIQFVDRYRGRAMALIIVQIDHADHLYADLDTVARTDLLATFAKRMRALTPAGAHLGLVDAGCFSTWLPGADEAQARHLASQLHEVSRTVTLNGNPMHITATTVWAHTSMLEAPILFWQSAWQTRADNVAAGGDRLDSVQSSTAQSTQSAQRISQSIPQAVEQEEFSLVVQPQWHISGDAITGIETLLRWHGVDVGTLEPDHFIPIAERDGQMARVGDWVLERVGMETTTWFEPFIAPIVVGINTSVQQFNNGAILEQIRRLSANNWLDPSVLELELSHTALLQVIDEHRKVVFALKDLGVRFAIDNLGQDLVDAELLLRCPADTLKIDRSVVGKLANDDLTATMLAEQICQLAAKFKLRCVAVGVEQERQRRALEHMGCSEAQGFLFAEPVSLKEFRALLTNSLTRSMA